jgi:hypothetical protein
MRAMQNNAVWLSLLLGVVACGDGESSGPGGAAGRRASGGTAGVAGAVGMGGAAGVGGAAGAGGTLGAGAALGAGGTVGGQSGMGGTSVGGAGAGGTVGTGGAGAMDGGSGTSGSAGTGTVGTGGGATGGTGGGSAMCPPSSAPAEFQPNTSVGPGGSQFKDSPHFRIYGGSGSAVDTTLNMLEAAYSCFVDDLCFRSPGLSHISDNGPYYKMNIYGVGSLGSAAGVMRYDARAGLSYLEVLTNQLPVPRVTVHEFGHGLTLTEYDWVDQTRTGAWWETVANWVADTYLTSSLCEGARTRFGVQPGATIIDLNRVISQSYLLIVSNQNYYEAWPFLTYLTTNLDNYPGLGRTALINMMRGHMRNNETPLHVLERVASPVKVQTILGRYWARMAYLDIGHPRAQEAFFSRRGSLNFANLDPAGTNTYRVKSARRPAYGGSNIIPLTGASNVSVQVTNLGNGRTESNFTATLSIRSNSGPVRYVDLPNGAGQATVASNEEASLVVVNTPNTLYQYDAFQTTASSPESIGLNYEVQITGATPR